MVGQGSESGRESRGFLAPPDCHGKPVYTFVTRRLRFRYRGRMAISNEHNLNSLPPAVKPFGIRVSLRPRDPFTRLVGADWQKLHWFATARERDEAYEDMASCHRYSRLGDEPAVVLERIAENTAR